MGLRKFQQPKEKGTGNTYKINIIGSFNLGAYIYNKTIFNWIRSIPNIHTVIDYTSIANMIGILEVSCEGKLSYQIGVFENPQSFLTISLQGEGKPERILVKKDTDKDNNPFKLKFGEKSYYDHF